MYTSVGSHLQSAYMVTTQVLAAIQARPASLAAAAHAGDLPVTSVRAILAAAGRSAPASHPCGLCSSRLRLRLLLRQLREAGRELRLAVRNWRHQMAGDDGVEIQRQNLLRPGARPLREYARADGKLSPSALVRHMVLGEVAADADLMAAHGVSDTQILQPLAEWECSSH